MKENTELLHPLARNAGNTIAEYSLIGSLVIASSVVILMLLGSNLNLVLQGLKGDTLAQTNNASSMNASQATVVADMQAMQNNLNSAVLDTAQNNSTIEVTAANGNTQGLFATTGGLKVPAPVLPQTPDQILAMERQMSDLTFLISKMQTQLQSVLSYSNNDPTKFMTTTLAFNGQNMRVITLATAIQNQITTLQSMQSLINASSATDSDKKTMTSLVSTVTGQSAAIYSQAQTLKSQYQKTIAEGKAALASKAAAFGDTGTAIAADQAAERARTVAAAASEAANSAASTAVANGASPTSTTDVVAATTQSADTMCTTGAGKANHDKCNATNPGTATP